MACKNRSLTLCLLFVFFTIKIYGQQTSAFPQSLPETEGVSSAGIDSFLTAQEHSIHEFHGFVFLRHGKAIAEGWWDPYKPTLKHMLYSTSKSFTSTAIGFALSENRLKLTDKVISFFPNSLPDTISPYLAQLTIKDLLTMSVGQTTDPTPMIPFKPGSWVKSFLALPIGDQPGTKFLYNSMSTYMLSAIVQKVTGQKVIDYLKPRLFDPLGIKGMDWEESAEGINTGGWGLRLKTEDIAKLGQLYLQKGKWNGKQVLPAAWVEQATTFKIDQAPGVAQSKKDSSDWMQGYCYQFWRCRHNAFRADGAFGQYIIVVPDQDAVIAINSESPNMQDELNLVWKYLLPAMKPQSLPLNKADEASLQKHLEGLSLPALKNIVGNSAANTSKTYALEPNELKIKSISFSTNNAGICRVTLKKDSATYVLNLGSGKWLVDQTMMPGPGLLSKANENTSMLSPYQIAGSYGWQDSQTMKLKLRYIESVHSETITCKFSDNKMMATVEYSYDFGKKKIVLNGDLTD
jgi:CubicO group peptidase (beta-lactamase class C family)